jgi:hypothetical protein
MRSSRLLTLLAGAAVASTLVLVPADAAAQRRVVRRPAPRPVVYVAARPYRSFYYPSFYSYGGWYSGWYGWSPYGLYAQPYPYYRSYPDYRGSARLQVQPRHTQVFIDGYFVGTVDDFDGWLQRLHVEPGEHELELYLEGHRTFRQQVLFRPGATLKLEHIMQPLQPGESPAAMPVPSPRAAQPQPQAGPGGPVPSPRRGEAMPQPRRGGPPSRTAESQTYGAVAIRVQPADAEVIVDGERWESPEAGDLTLQLAEGSYPVEIRKEGYRPYSATVSIRRGETTSLNVSLSQQ